MTSALRGQTEATASIAITASISVPPCPPSASGDGDAEQALLRHQPGDVPRITGRMRALERAGGEMLLGEAAHRIAKLLLLGRQTESPCQRPLAGCVPSGTGGRVQNAGVSGSSTTGFR